MMIKGAYADRENVKSGSHTKQKYRSRKLQNEQKCRSTKIQNTGIQDAGGDKNMAIPIQDTGEYKNMAIQIQE